MAEINIRWHQRFQNYQKALHKLTEAVNQLELHGAEKEIVNQMSELEREGLIQRFEYTHELAWKVMKDYLKEQGIQEIGGSKDAVRGANQLELITQAEVWMDMISGRNATSHTYDEEIAENIFLKIVFSFYPLLKEFEIKMESKKNVS
jgi:nucleotidyltransferase substrate binding protein (TIGR01987 family)